MTPQEKHTNKRTIKRNNCQPRIRFSAIDNLGRQMTLVGRYAFDYSIMIETSKGISCFSFATRKEAISEFNKKKAKKRK